MKEKRSLPSRYKVFVLAPILLFGLSAVPFLLLGKQNSNPNSEPQFLVSIFADHVAPKDISIPRGSILLLRNEAQLIGKESLQIEIRNKKTKIVEKTFTIRGGRSELQHVFSNAGTFSLDVKKINEHGKIKQIAGSAITVLGAATQKTQEQKKDIVRAKYYRIEEQEPIYSPKKSDIFNVKSDKGHQKISQKIKKINSASDIPLEIFHGLTGEYHEGEDIDPARFSIKRIDKKIDFVWEDDARPPVKDPVSGFSAHWSGNINPAYSERYSFLLDKYVKDSADLWIDGIHLWGSSATDNSIILNKSKSYPIYIRFSTPERDLSDAERETRLRLFWSSANQEHEIVPSTGLSTDGRGIGKNPDINFFRALGQYQTPDNTIMVEPHEIIRLAWESKLGGCDLSYHNLAEPTSDWRRDVRPSDRLDVTTNRNVRYSLRCENGENSFSAKDIIVQVIDQFPCDFENFKNVGAMSCGHIEWKTDRPDISFASDPREYLMKYDDLYNYYKDFTGYEPSSKKIIVQISDEMPMSAASSIHLLHMPIWFFRDQFAVIAEYKDKPLSASLMHEMGHIFTLPASDDRTFSYMWHKYLTEPYADLTGIFFYEVFQKQLGNTVKFYWDAWCNKYKGTAPCEDYFTSAEQYLSVNPTEEQYKTFFAEGGTMQLFYDTEITGYNHEHATKFTHIISDLYRYFDESGKGKEFYEAYKKTLHFYNTHSFPPKWKEHDNSKEMIAKKHALFAYLLSVNSGTDITDLMNDRWRFNIRSRVKELINFTLECKRGLACRKASVKELIRGIKAKAK